MSDKKTQRKPQSRGKCSYCGKSYTKGGLTKHLVTCKARKESNTKAVTKSKAKPQKIFHIVASDYYDKDYWLHIEIPAKSTLAILDSFLRDIWLECCGHLSMFKIHEQSYSVHPMTEYGDKSMKFKLEQVLRSGMTFQHEYDFGTTTYLSLQVIGERESIVKPNEIHIMARNDPPKIMCQECGENLATEVCSMCIWEYNSKAWLCEKCLPKHGCEEDYFLPVVNSPRVGMCGYTG
jgi:hypothetical protein